MIESIFVSDLHGDQHKYKKLISYIKKFQPGVVFIGGDLLPAGIAKFTSLDLKHKDFINGFLVPIFMDLKESLGTRYPKIYVIMGNDDARIEEPAIIDASTKGIWDYVHQHRRKFKGFSIFGYNYVPPTPFRLKDWERYDVSRFVDNGCISPEEGLRTMPVRQLEARNATIKDDLEFLSKNEDLENSIFLFHSPPYKSKLDRAALDGKMIDYAPLDVHVGSIAIRKFIEERKPKITLHGHVHESTSLTGSWMEKIKCTYCYNAAHNGSELSIIRINLDNPENSSRILV